MKVESWCLLTVAADLFSLKGELGSVRAVEAKYERRAYPNPLSCPSQRWNRTRFSRPVRSGGRQRSDRPDRWPAAVWLAGPVTGAGRPVVRLWPAKIKMGFLFYKLTCKMRAIKHTKIMLLPSTICCLIRNQERYRDNWVRRPPITGWCDRSSTDSA